MDANNKIENLFRDNLSNYTARPSEGVWNGISYKLIGPRFEFLYQSAFKGFTSMPKEIVWKKIASVMWVKNFVHFNPFSFNAYYMGAISIVGTSVFLSYNFNLFNSPGEMLAEKHSEITVDNFESAQNNIKPAQDIYAIENEIIDEIENNFPNNLQNLNISQNILAERTNPEAKEHSEPIVFSDEFEEASESFISKDIKSFISSTNRLKAFAIPNIIYSPSIRDFAQSIVFNENLGINNVTIFDTLGTDYKGDDIIIKRSYFELSGFYTFENTQYNISGTNPELVSQTDNFIQRHKAGRTFSVGLNLAYNYKSVLFETGLHYNRLSEVAEFEVGRIEYTENQFYEFSEDSFWQTDTLGWILDLDEYLQGNTVYIPYTDSSQVFVKDSVLITITDSTSFTELQGISSNYHIIAVPVIFGYEFNIGKLSLTPKAGIISGFLIKKNGYVWNPESNMAISVNSAAHTGILFDAFGAFNIKYRFHPKISLYAEPNTRIMLNSMYDKSWAINQKAFRFGISAGIAIKL